MVAIGFPFGTWACGLLAYYGLGGRHHQPFIGTRWSTPSSGVKLIGFVIILAANVAFLLFKSGHTCASLVFGRARPQKLPGSSEEEQPSEEHDGPGLAPATLEGFGLAPAASWFPKGRVYRGGGRSVRLPSTSRKGSFSASGSASRWVERLDTF